LEDLTLTKVHTVFKIYPQQTQQLICRGILPEHPKGKPSRAYILALGKYCKGKDREITPEAEALLKSVQGGVNE